ncbi:MAG: MBG domain-containing protein, partial [Leptospirillia bacterium]
GLTGTLSTANVGTSLGGTLTVTGSDLTGTVGFNASNYSLPTTFTGGAVTPAPLTATANSASMTYGGTLPSLSGTVTGFVNGQTLSGDSGTANWTTTATSSSNAGQYGITGSVTLGSPYSGDYTITNASGNSTALAITAATSGSGTTGSSSSGSGTQGAITSKQIVPVVQTVDNFQSLPSLPGISSVAPSTNDSASSSSSSNTSSSSTQTTLADSGNSSVTVIEPVETGDEEILSVEELKK